MNLTRIGAVVLINNLASNQHIDSDYYDENDLQGWLEE